MPSVISTYEERVRKLEDEKLLVKDRMANLARPASSFEYTLRTALDFLADPPNLWSTGRPTDRRAVLKLTFVDRLQYDSVYDIKTGRRGLSTRRSAEIVGTVFKRYRGTNRIILIETRPAR
ncbi:MAG: hypothetical protein R3D68_00095 [Hyphomicrobiaceae bacterium]